MNATDTMHVATPMIDVVGGLGVSCELRDSGGLGPASPEASELKGAAPLPPMLN